MSIKQLLSLAVTERIERQIERSVVCIKMMYFTAFFEMFEWVGVDVIAMVPWSSPRVPTGSRGR